MSSADTNHRSCALDRSTEPQFTASHAIPGLDWTQEAENAASSEHSSRYFISLGTSIHYRQFMSCNLSWHNLASQSQCQHLQGLLCDPAANPCITCTSTASELVRSAKGSGIRVEPRASRPIHVRRETATLRKGRLVVSRSLRAHCAEEMPARD